MAKVSSQGNWYLGDPRDMGFMNEYDMPNDIAPSREKNDKKYKWNGLYLNIGDQDPKDYASTIFKIKPKE